MLLFGVIFASEEAFDERLAQHVNPQNNNLTPLDFCNAMGEVPDSPAAEHKLQPRG